MQKIIPVSELQVGDKLSSEVSKYGTTSITITDIKTTKNGRFNVIGSHEWTSTDGTENNVKVRSISNSALKGNFPITIEI